MIPIDLHDTGSFLSETNRQCAVVVVSCDGYSDLWTPFFTLFWRHWPECPFPVYLTANRMKFDHPKVHMLLSRTKSNWSEELKKCLMSLEVQEVLVVLEDFFFRAPVETSALLRAIEEWRSLEGVALRLHPQPGPDKDWKKRREFGICSAGAPYRVSLQATLWNRIALISLLRDGETAWQFEVLGTERAMATKGEYYCSYKSLIPYKTHVVEKGEWYRDAACIFGKSDIGCDFSQRRIMSIRTYARLRWQRAWSSLLNLLSWQIRFRWSIELDRFPRAKKAVHWILYLKSAANDRRDS